MSFIQKNRGGEGCGKRHSAGKWNVDGSLPKCRRGEISQENVLGHQEGEWGSKDKAPGGRSVKASSELPETQEERT